MGWHDELDLSLSLWRTTSANAAPRDGRYACARAGAGSGAGGEARRHRPGRGSAEEPQEKIRRESVDAGELAAGNRLLAAVERFDMTALLLHEKRRFAQSCRGVELRE